MAAILKLKNILKPQKEKSLSIKHWHFLNQLSKNRLKEILLFSEAEEIEKNAVNLKNKRVLFFDDGEHKYIYKKLIKNNPDYFLSYFYGVEQPQKRVTEDFMVCGGLSRMPLRKNFFDVVICPFAAKNNKVNDALISKLSSLIKNGGRILLSVSHPQLEYAIYNQNPSETRSSQGTVSYYFNQLKENNIFCENLSEGLVNSSLKPFFSVEGEYDYYHEYKHLPLTLLIKAVKYTKK